MRKGLLSPSLSSKGGEPLQPLPKRPGFGRKLFSINASHSRICNMTFLEGPRERRFFAFCFPFLLGRLGRGRDGCWDGSKFKIPHVYRPWDGGTAIYPQGPPPPVASPFQAHPALPFPLLF